MLTGLDDALFRLLRCDRLPLCGLFEPGSTAHLHLSRAWASSNWFLRNRSRAAMQSSRASDRSEREHGPLQDQEETLLRLKTIIFQQFILYRRVNSQFCSSHFCLKAALCKFKTILTRCVDTAGKKLKDSDNFYELIKWHSNNTVRNNVIIIAKIFSSDSKNADPDRHGVNGCWSSTRTFTSRESVTVAATFHFYLMARTYAQNQKMRKSCDFLHWFSFWSDRRRRWLNGTLL